MSRGLQALERFLGDAGFDRAPWLAVAFGAGIAAWLALPTPGDWCAFLAVCVALAAASIAVLRPDGRYPYVRLILLVLPIAMAAGCGSIWVRSATVGAEPIARPMVASISGRVLSVEAQPARQRWRLLLAVREPGSGRAIKVRLNVPADVTGRIEVTAGALVRVKARLMPPAPPMLPGSYDFARAAWFDGLAATGTALEPPTVLEAGTGGRWLAGLQHRISEHVRHSLPPAEAGIAAALATGDMGGIAQTDDQAMRDSGLAHLLSVSGLHVSAVVGAAYVVTLRLLALWPWLALRVRLPIAAAAAGALAGVGYTLLTGAQVPTVRSCFGALLVLGALALGREPLSLRMLAIAAFLVLLLWPEAVAGPSFQMSFAAVLAIVALSGAGPVKRFLAPREEGLLARGARHLAMILLTGMVIELALMPIGLYHFHRAGLYGSFANVVAIPLTTVAIMPAVLGALVLDLVGAGAPAWWVAKYAIALLLGVAHWVASRPGSVMLLPAFGGLALALFVAGGLWLALWSGKVRWLGAAPAAAGAVMIASTAPPDILVSGDGRHVGLVSASGELYVLRQSRTDFARSNLTEVAGMRGQTVPIEQWPDARCNRDVCVASLERGGRNWTLLMTRGPAAMPERAVVAACDRVDIVISDRWLPRSCRPRWLKADRRSLAQSGGLTLDLRDEQVTSVAESQGSHPWWLARLPKPDAADRKTPGATAGGASTSGK